MQLSELAAESDRPSFGTIGGGERGIRTLGTFRYTRFPSVRLKPLGHLSESFSWLAGADCNSQRRGERETLSTPCRSTPSGANWRRERDSNPRYGFKPYAGLANLCLQPLGHLSHTGGSIPRFSGPREEPANAGSPAAEPPAASDRQPHPRIGPAKKRTPPARQRLRRTRRRLESGGEGGIRTLEGLASLAVFKTAAFNRSATSPRSQIVGLRGEIRSERLARPNCGGDPIASQLIRELSPHLFSAAAADSPGSGRFARGRASFV